MDGVLTLAHNMIRKYLLSLIYWALNAKQIDFLLYFTLFKNRIEFRDLLCPNVFIPHIEAVFLFCFLPWMQQIKRYKMKTMWSVQREIMGKTKKLVHFPAIIIDSMVHLAFKALFFFYNLRVHMIKCKQLSAKTESWTPIELGKKLR